jgi:hypothetical protein
MKVILIRFLIGGIAVSVFAVLGDLLKPKSFAGLFGAAPSIALATLGLTVASDGRHFAASEANSMIAGAIAFFVYTLFCELDSDARSTQRACGHSLCAARLGGGRVRRLVLLARVAS